MRVVTDIWAQESKMLETITAVGAVLTALSVGGAVGAFLQHRLQTRREPRLESDFIGIETIQVS